MSSTYSSSLRIQLIDTDTEFEAWGQPLDNNLGTIIEQAIVGSNTISLTNLTSYTLTTANAAVDQARNAVLVFTGALSANCNVIAPSVQKVYVVSNQTTGGRFVNIKTSSGNAVSVINGTNQLVYCNGTDFISAVNVNTVLGNLTVSGNATVAGNVTIGGNILASNVIASSNGNITTTSNTSIVQLSNNTGAFVLPTGNTAQRPSTVKLGMQRWNTSLNWMELWNGIVWYPLTGSYGVTYVVVAGGGGGGAAQFGSGGGGGAGGALIGGTTVQTGTAYSIVIGGGGAGWGFPGGVNTGTGTNGSNTTALGFTVIGGGGGGYNGANGISGGSGGGMGGSGTSGQGFAGGNSGGGGAGQVGGNSSGVGPSGGAGGNGTASSISGTLTYYAGGGAGGLGDQNPGITVQGGLGGGGTSATTGSGNGTANRGGGGGGASQSGPSQTAGGSGGSGITILSYESPTQTATGGTVTSYSAGGDTYWVHTFTTSGTFTA